MLKFGSLRNAWLLMAVFTALAFLIATQNWYTVRYSFGQSSAVFTAAGLSSWPLVQSACWIWLIVLVVLLVTRGWPRIALSWLNVVFSAAVAGASISVLRGGIPEYVNGQIEKLSGISGSASSGGASDAVLSLTQSPLASMFVALAFVYAVLSVLVALVAPKWVTKSDKYVRANGKQSVTDADNSRAAVSANATDTIGLWDSQR